MQPALEERFHLVRQYYQAYDNSDRPAIEALLSSAFTFNSPLDDCIERNTYFDRCWPNHAEIVHFTLLDLCGGADGVLVRYSAHTTDQTTFSNVEYITFADGLIAHIDVFFGSLPG